VQGHLGIEGTGRLSSRSR